MECRGKAKQLKQIIGMKNVHNIRFVASVSGSNMHREDLQKCVSDFTLNKNQA